MADMTASECFICLQPGGRRAAGRELLRGGCACRGTSGFVHTSCAVTAARIQAETWVVCPTCKQFWTGDLQLRLARERYRLHNIAHDPANLDWRDAAIGLIEALGENGKRIHDIVLHDL